MPQRRIVRAPIPWSDIRSTSIHACYQNTRPHTVQSGYIGLWQASKHTPTEKTGCGQSQYGVTKIH